MKLGRLLLGRLPQLLTLSALTLGGCSPDEFGAREFDGHDGIEDYSDPKTCGQCHERQYQEWESSMMRYGATSPVFNALESLGNDFTGGAFAAGGEQELLCQGCHSPASVEMGEFPEFELMGGKPSRDFMGETGAHGLSCDVCHQVAGPDLENSLLGDGIANGALLYEPGGAKRGPIHDPIANAYHEPEPTQFLSDPKFCGACHDVRLPSPDPSTGESFGRLEDAFTEWEQGPYASANNPYGRVTTCQDCHMSAYPYEPPGTYFVGQAAQFPGAPSRRISTHYFTGVDVALMEEFPGQYGDGVDDHGLPSSQDQRRKDLLRASCEVELWAPTELRGDVLQLSVAITNTGAGHNVPTGFSQERQMWIELIVRDANGDVVYESGTLEDAAHPETGEMQPDGSLNDEDLKDFVGKIDPTSFEAHLEPGPDHNERPDHNRGLVNFGNVFYRSNTEGEPDEVFVPFLADIMDNSHSIAPLETRQSLYDIEVEPGTPGPLQVTARLRFRAFPPRFLRMLAVGKPQLVNEALVDRNEIVEMGGSEATVATVEAP